MNNPDEFNDPKDRILLTLKFSLIRLKRDIKGIKIIQAIMLFGLLIITTKTFNTSSYQFASNFLGLTLLAIIFYIVMIISSVIRPPTWEKKKINKWDSKLFSDLFIFTFIQLILGAQAFLISTQSNKSAIIPLFILSFFISVIVLFLYKFFVWFLEGRKRK